jgi:hypothetical protein
VVRQAQHERSWEEHALIPHRDANVTGVASLSVGLRSSSRHTIGLRYRVHAAATLVVPEHVGGPIDGLWRSTCFELFVRAPGAPSYLEYNFAPSSGWAAYRFSDRRTGMVPALLDRPPLIVDGRDEPSDNPHLYEFWVYVDRDDWPRGEVVVGLSAVIEEVDGTKSYWALAHPPGAPDFHHPDCFALHIPALA